MEPQEYEYHDMVRRLTAMMVQQHEWYEQQAQLNQQMAALFKQQAEINQRLEITQFRSGGRISTSAESLASIAEASMPYSDFTLLSAEQAFEVRRREVRGLFVHTAPLSPSPWLEETLAEGIPLANAINTEKARSELLIMPILLDVRRHFPGQVSVFSGILFDVDAARGLTGFADFLLSRTASQLVVTAPVAVIVEAKNDNLPSGLGQCLATMVAARCFNTRAQTGVIQILGAVSTGTRWRFLVLDGEVVTLDLDEYALQGQVAHILGILACPLREDVSR